MRRPGPRARLGLLTALLVAVPLALALLHVVSAHELRDGVRHASPLAPLAYVLVSALLGAALFPGPVLAAASGLLFGTAVGTVCTVTSAVLSALVSRWLGARAGSSDASQAVSPRVLAVARGRGTELVLVQRLLPAVPDAPLSYAFGAVGVPWRAVAVGTALGTLPRAFSYTALGAAVDDPHSPLAVVGLTGLVLSALLGAVLGRRAWRSVRAAQEQ